MRAGMLWLVLAAGPALAEIRDVMKSAEIDRAFAGLRDSKPVHEGPGYAVVFEAYAGQGREIERADADQMIFVRKGAGRLTLDGARAHTIGGGDFVHIRRRTKYRLEAASGRLELIVVRILGETGAEGQRPAPRTMADVLTHREIAETFAKATANQPIHASPAYTMNYVIYKGRVGPWESHAGCVDIYFVHEGQATAKLGGEIQNPREEGGPGEIRGTGVTNARAHEIGPGDLVVIPRNGAHHMEPAAGKLGYILLKVWASSNR